MNDSRLSLGFGLFLSFACSTLTLGKAEASGLQQQRLSVHDSSLNFQEGEQYPVYRPEAVGDIGSVTKMALNRLGSTASISLAAAQSLCAPPAHGVTTFTRSLDLGSAGADVKALQFILRAQGYLGAAPTGYYDTLTEAAVAKFQTIHGFEPVGSVGPQIRTILNALASAPDSSATMLAMCAGSIDIIGRAHVGADSSTATATTSPLPSEPRGWSPSFFDRYIARRAADAPGLVNSRIGVAADFSGQRDSYFALTLPANYLNTSATVSHSVILTAAPSDNNVSSGTAYYVSPSGSDFNNGTSSTTAWQTIAKVNVASFVPGDRILFQGGQSFTGCLKLNSINVRSRGDKNVPITLDSYGTGNATLLSNCPGNLHALLTLDGVSGVKVQNLVLSANGTQTSIGILVQNSVARNIVDTVVIQDVDVSGFSISGPSVSGSEIVILGFATNGNCGALNNIQVLNSKLHGASGPTSPDDNGISGYACNQNITNVLYQGNEVFDIGGHAPANGGVSGNGIIANGVNGGVEQFNLVHDNGANARTCGGPGGVWAYKSNNIIIRFNEVYHMRPLPSNPGNGACDWVAYDLDTDVTNSIIEYNYSHDNAGAAWLAYNTGKWGPNNIRYNISENDDIMATSGPGSAALSLDAGGIWYFYNNAIFVPSGNTGGTTPPSCASFGHAGIAPVGALYANNLCVISKTDQYGRTRFIDGGNGPNASAMTIVNNLDYNPNGDNRWNFNNIEYSSLAAAQAAGFEAGSMVANPLLAGAGNGGTCSRTQARGGGPQPCPGGYQLQAGSPAIGTGRDLTRSPYSLSIGSSDYFGNAVPNGRGSGFNIGAY